MQRWVTVTILCAPHALVNLPLQEAVDRRLKGRIGLGAHNGRPVYVKTGGGIHAHRCPVTLFLRHKRRILVAIDARSERRSVEANLLRELYEKRPVKVPVIFAAASLFILHLPAIERIVVRPKLPLVER